MPSDELLVLQLSDLAQGCSLQGDAVYHLEIYQTVDGTDQASYPCYVYRKADHAPELELTGEASVEDDTYEVVAVARDSDSLRCLANSLQRTYRYAFLQALQAASPEVLDWVVENDNELNEFASEQQDKGYKTATILVRIVLDTLEGDEVCPQ